MAKLERVTFKAREIDVNFLVKYSNRTFYYILLSGLGEFETLRIKSKIFSVVGPVCSDGH